MKFRQESKISAGLKQIDIVPLIDCVFLLLIFFMLSSSFVAVPGVTIDLPKAVTAEQIDSRPLTVIISPENIVYLEDKPYTVDEIEEYLRRKKVNSIFIKADKDASLGKVVAIWDICKKLNITRIGIATTHE